MDTADASDSATRMGRGIISGYVRGWGIKSYVREEWESTLNLEERAIERAIPTDLSVQRLLVCFACGCFCVHSPH